MRLGPVFYLMYASHIPKFEHDTIGTFADDTVVLVFIETTKKQQINYKQPLTKSTVGPKYGKSS